MSEISFTDDMNPTRAANVAGVLLQPRLLVPPEDYYGPRHVEWVEMSEAEIAEGRRFAMLATVDRQPVGAIVARPNPDKPHVIDIRNITISQSVAGLRFGTFMLRNAEHLLQNANPETKLITVDTKLSNTAMIGFLLAQRYQLSEITDLYGSGELDMVLAKTV